MLVAKRRRNERCEAYSFVVTRFLAAIDTILLHIALPLYSNSCGRCIIPLCSVSHAIARKDGHVVTPLSTSLSVLKSQPTIKTFKQLDGCIRKFLYTIIHKLLTLNITK